jgi:hypothetical protein
VKVEAMNHSHLMHAILKKDINFFDHAMRENHVYHAITSFASSDIIMHLVQQNFNLLYFPHPEEKYHSTVMHVAVEIKNIEALNVLLLAAPFLRYQKDFRGWTPYDYALKLGDLQTQHIFDLFDAILINNRQFIVELINNYISIIPDCFYNKIYVLQWATIHNKEEARAALIEVLPACKEIPDPFGFKASEYIFSQQYYYEDFINLILTHDIDNIKNYIENYLDLKKARSQRGFDPLSEAIASKVPLEIIILLFEQELYELTASTYYHTAVRFDNVEALEYLSKNDQFFESRMAFEEEGGFRATDLINELQPRQVKAWWEKRNDDSLLNSLVISARKILDL